MTALENLGDAAANLLTHHDGTLTGSRPFLVEKDGRLGVAIVIDGWYSSEVMATVSLDYWTPLQVALTEALTAYRKTRHEDA
ncbi:MAG: hypothetical protein H6525_07405 [Actinobacteria bacterium]|nr:hypothetical protein [Actinomycetota bacterium]MCB9412655.1 hypothetical protein [Actinomycetota bacterium]